MLVYGSLPETGKPSAHAFRFNGKVETSRPRWRTCGELVADRLQKTVLHFTASMYIIFIIYPAKPIVGPTHLSTGYLLLVECISVQPPLWDYTPS